MSFGNDSDVKFDSVLERVEGFLKFAPVHSGSLWYGRVGVKKKRLRVFQVRGLHDVQQSSVLTTACRDRHLLLHLRYYSNFYHE